MVLGGSELMQRDSKKGGSLCKREGLPSCPPRSKLLCERKKAPMAGVECLHTDKTMG
jgi:hypothetical protein